MVTVTNLFRKGLQFFNNDETEANGGTISFFDAGTSNPQTVYSNAAGTASLGTSVTLDSNGRLSTPVYISTTGTKYEARGTDASTLFPAEDNIPGAVESAGEEFSKTQSTFNTITANSTLLAGDAGESFILDTTSNNITITLPSAASVGDGRGFTFLKISPNFTAIINGIPYKRHGKTIEYRSDGANWRRVTDAGFVKPQGYLTLVTGTPQITSDQASKTTVYYTPDQGNLIPINDGAGFTPVGFSELSLTLNSNHLADTIYDVFVWNESGTITIGTGPAWTTSTAGSGARGAATSLQRVEGLLVNDIQITARNGATTYTVAANNATYVGSILIDGSAGEVTCHTTFGQSRRWGVWNAYNRRKVILKAGDTTSSWSYTTGTIRASNNASANHVKVFSGLQDDRVNATFVQNVRLDLTGTGSGEMNIGVGKNSTTSMSGKQGQMFRTHSSSNTINHRNDIVATYNDIIDLGLTEVYCLETSPETDTDNLFFGSSSLMEMSVDYFA